MINDDKNRLLKRIVTEHSSDENFRHHEWFVKYHLEIVERIAEELRARYRDANTPWLLRATCPLHS